MIATINFPAGEGWLSEAPHTGFGGVEGSGNRLIVLFSVSPVVLASSLNLLLYRPFCRIRLLYYGG
jgi:hypothetical protein